MVPVIQILNVLSGIPWKEVLKYGQPIVAAASGLLAKNKTATSQKVSLETRIARLEENERAQAELIKNMAERQEFLLNAVQLLDKRIKYIFGISILLAIGLIFALVKMMLS